MSVPSVIENRHDLWQVHRGGQVVIIANRCETLHHATMPPELAARVLDLELPAMLGGRRHSADVYVTWTYPEPRLLLGGWSLDDAPALRDALLTWYAGELHGEAFRGSVG